MFMRFVQLPIRPEAVEAYTSFYNFRIGPALRDVPGCLFARLIQDSSTESRLLSFTVWESAEAVHEYEESGLFNKLMNEGDPFAEDTTEWKIELSDDMRLEYKPVHDEPEIKAMNVVAGTKEGDPVAQIGDFTYVRIVSATLAPKTHEDFERLYDDVITPKLLAVDGCRGAYLIKLNDEVDILSVTVWENERSAETAKAQSILDSHSFRATG